MRAVFLRLLGYETRVESKIESGGETCPDARRVPQPSVGARTEKATGALPDSASPFDFGPAFERLVDAS